MVIMKKKTVFAVRLCFLLLVAGCAELPTASYADGSRKAARARRSPRAAKENRKLRRPRRGKAAALQTLPPKEVTENTLRICVDINHISSGIERDTQIGMDRILQLCGGKGGPTDVAVEYILASGSEREIMLENLRVELMSRRPGSVYSGRRCLWAKRAVSDDRSLDALRVFLPLDTYIEKLAVYGGDKLTPKSDRGRPDGRGRSSCRWRTRCRSPLPEVGGFRTRPPRGNDMG